VFAGLIFSLSIVYMLFVNMQGHCCARSGQRILHTGYQRIPREGGQRHLLVMSSSGQEICSSALSSSMVVVTFLFIHSSSLML
jgi:hypothetical protein